MPNDLTTKRTLLDAREDLRLESRRKLASSGFTASTWTLSGVVLVACGGAGEITDALCPNFDAAVLVSCGGGGGPNVQSSQGESHFVQSSPVRGARLYFDTNNNKVVDDTVMDPDIATQDGQYPEGFTTDANGVAENIPEHLFGKPFVAYLDGAINADTGVPFPEDTRYYSIPNAEGQHTIATPITNWIAQYAGFTEGLVRTSSQVRDAVNDVIANFLGHEAYSSILTDDELTAFNLLYAAILNPESYAGNPIIEALSAYLATNPSLADMRSNAQTLINDAQTLIAALMEADPAVLANLPDTLILLHADADTTSANMIDLPDVTIGTNAGAGAYIATVYAVGTGRVSYSIVDENGAEVIGGNFVVDERTGVISVADSVTTLSAETTELYVQVTSGGETETVKIDVTVQSVATLTPPTTSGTMEIAENMLGSDADPVVTGIDAGSSAVKANFIISDAADSPPGYADMFDIVQNQDGTTWNLVLRDTESLDYEAIDNLRLRDTQALDEQAIVNGAIKLNVRYQTTNPSDPNNPLFSDPLEFTIRVMNGEDITFSGDFGGVVTEDADEDADADSLVATGSISVNNNSDNADVTVTDSGTYGELVLDDSGTWTYTLGEGADAAAMTKIQQLRTGEILVDTATISVASTPAATKNIYITIIGANEDVHFADANDPTMRDISVATVPDAMDIQIGAAALDGSFDLGNVFDDFGVTLMEWLDDNDPTTQDRIIEFADSVPMNLRALFDLTEKTEVGDEVGDLTFTGTSAEAAELGIGTIELAMIASAPQSTTLDIPLTVRVNVALAAQTISIDENDDSPDFSTLPTGNGAIIYTIIDGNEDDKFATDDTTGAITLNPAEGALDFENDATSYMLEITATDGEGDTATAMITINVGDVNEHAPVFVTNTDDTSLADTTIEVAEDAANDDRVGLFRATDADGTNNVVDYTLAGGGGAFAIREVAGSTDNNWEIYVADATQLNYDSATKSYSLMVTASDSDPDMTVRKSTMETFTINLTDVNDIVPTYTTSGTASVERMPNGNTNDIMTGYSITVTDADTDDADISVSVSGDADNRFEFQRGTTNTWNLVLIKTKTVTETVGTDIALTYTVSDGDNTAATDGSVTVSVIMGNTPQSPAIIPDRQSFAHQDSYDPDDLGLTPMPDADPQAG